MDNLLYLANKIPEMGNGGKKIRNELIRYAKKVLPGNAIFDFAPFLGSTTAFLSYGLIKSNNTKSTIYAVDKWELEKKYITWLKKKNIIVDDLEQEFTKNMKPFVDAKARIKPTRCDIRDYRYIGGPVQLLVDDLGICKSITDHVLKTAFPNFIPGLTIIVFMDFYFYEDYKDYESRLYQRDLMEANKHAFEFIEHPQNSRTAIYRYLGGEINYIDGEKYYYDFRGIT